MSLTKPVSGSPFGTGAYLSTTIVGSIVDSINQQVYNVMDTGFGALGDGSTDDAAAINLAITTANADGGGIVYLPPNTYAVKTPIDLLSNVTLEGAGQGASIIKAIASYTGTVLLRSNNVTGVTFCNVKNLKLDGNSLVSTVAQLWGTAGAPGHNLMYRCRIQGGTTIGVDLGGLTPVGYECDIDRCSVSNAGTSILLSGTDCKVTHCNVGSATTYCVDIQQGGCIVTNNHLVIGNASAQSVRIAHGYAINVAHNYMGSSVGDSGPLITVAIPAASGFTVTSALIDGNTLDLGGLVTDNLYPAITIDRTNGALDNIAVRNNVAYAQSTAKISAFVVLTASPTNVSVDGNAANQCYLLYSGGTPTYVGDNYVNDGTGRVVRARRTIIDLPYSAAISTDASMVETARITATNGVAFTINSATNGVKGLVLTYIIKNTSGGALGAITWGGAFHLAGAFVSPATGFNRSITFQHDGGSYMEMYRTAADVAN